MELTKQDRKHIDEEVTRLAFRINIESKEYALLYEREYLEALVGKLRCRIEAIAQAASCGIKASEPQTTTSK